jgi:O-antigen/teichoic acid export membrane protein
MPEVPLRRLLVKNTTIQMVAQAVAVLTGLGNSWVLSRCLGVEGFGQFSYVFAFYYFFLALNDFGVNTIVLREVSQRRDRAAEIIGSMLTLKVAVSLFLLVCAWIVVWMMQSPGDLRNALWVFSLVLPLLALQLPMLIFQVNLEAWRPAIVAIVNRCLGFILVLAALGLGRTLMAVVTALVVSECVSLALVHKLSRSVVRPIWRIDPQAWLEILRSIIPLGLASLFSAIINRVDFVMLERMTDLHQLGLYSAAYKVTNLLETFPLILMGTIYPLMSRSAKDDPERLKRLYWRTLLLLGSVALPIGATVTLAAPWIVQIVFGSEFLGTVPALRVLVWSTVAMYVAIVGGYLLISAGRERINLILNGCGAVLNVTLNLWFIPAWGFVGAAWSTTITFAFSLFAVTVASLLVLKSLSPRQALMEFERGHAPV